MKTYRVTEKLPPCGAVVRVKAGHVVETDATFDGVDWVSKNGQVFMSGAVTEWSFRRPTTAEGYLRMLNQEQEKKSLCEKIAYDAARSEIECHCLEPVRHWYDVESATVDDKESTAESVRYLDLIGSLVRHPTKSHLVMVLDREA